MCLTLACHGIMSGTPAACAGMVKSAPRLAQRDQVRQVKGACGPGRIDMANGCAGKCVCSEGMQVAIVIVLPG